MFGNFKTLLAGVGLAMAVATLPVKAEKIVIGHFGNPTPMQAAAVEGKFLRRDRLGYRMA